jgi:hypothetical protein
MYGGGASVLTGAKYKTRFRVAKEVAHTPEIEQFWARNTRIGCFKKDFESFGNTFVA